MTGRLKKGTYHMSMKHAQNDVSHTPSLPSIQIVPRAPVAANGQSAAMDDMQSEPIDNNAASSNGDQHGSVVANPRANGAPMVESTSVGDRNDAINHQMPATEPENAHTPPTIESEASEAIHVGAGGTLKVPREDLDADLDDGEEIDLVSQLALKIHKPDRREWIAVKRESELTTRMLLHKPTADGFDTDYYYVDKTLRDPIRTELKEVRVFLYYSFNAKVFGLWIANFTPGNTYYDPLHVLFQRPVEFFAANAVRIISDTKNRRNRVKCKKLPNDVSWPTKSTSELLGEALGPDHFITSSDHPIYRDLIEGEELDL